MSYKDILKDIKENNLKKVYLCYGNEDYLKDWILLELKSKYIEKTFESLNYIYMDGKDSGASNIVNACETLPFMSEKKIVVVEGLPFFSGAKSVNTEDEDELNSYLSRLGDSTCLVFIEKEEKLDNRKKLVKKIKSVGSIIEINRIKDEELSKWITKIFNKEKKKISKGTVIHFIQNSGYLDVNSNKTLYDLENEIIKISNYLGDREEVTAEDIDKVLVKSLQNNIFKLVDGIGQKRADLALRVFNEMLLDNQPVLIIMSMIIRQFRLLFMAKLLEEKGYSQGNIAEKIKVPNFIAQKVIQQSRNFTEKELEEGLNKCLEIDIYVKSGKIDNKLAIEMLLTRFAQ